MKTHSKINYEQGRLIKILIMSFFNKRKRNSKVCMLEWGLLLIDHLLKME